MIDTRDSKKNNEQAASDLDKTRPAPKSSDATQSKSKQEEPKQAHNYAEKVVGVSLKTVNWFNAKGPFITALATVSIAVLTGFYVKYSKAQWKAMSDQLTITRQQLEGMQAAVVHFNADINPASSSGPYLVNVLIQNSGHVISNSVAGEITVEIESLPSKKQLGETFHGQILSEPLPPARPEGGGGRTEHYSVPGFNRTTWESAMRLEKTVRVEMHLRYDNGFGHTFEKFFCRSLLATNFVSRDPVTKTAQHPNSIGLVDCNEFDAKLTQALENKQLVDEDARKQIEKESRRRKLP